jgi:Fuc2NAc and GlcNAc transferase
VVHVAAGATLAWLASPDRAAPIGALVLAAWAAWWVFWTVSAINVVNFMDGIDGLIGSQIALYSAYVVAASPSASYAAAFGAALAGAALGFLPWNWSPARIFLGDVGSGALGCAAVVAGLLAIRSTGLGIVGAYLPLFPLFLDGAATIVRRARRGERLTTPHRSHLYQRLANSAWGHARVSILYLVAAGAGAGVALWGATAGPVAGAAASCVYATAVAVTGWWLDRSVPLPPRERPHARAA